MFSSLKSKLIFVFTIMILLFLTMSGTGYYESLRDGNVARTLALRGVPLVSAVKDVRVHILNHRRYEKDLFLNFGDKEKQANYIEKFKRESQEFRESLKELRSLLEESPDLVKHAQLVGDLERNYQTYHDGVMHVYSQLQSDASLTPRQANMLVMPFKESVYVVETTAAKLEEEICSAVDWLSKDMVSTARTASMFFLISAVVGVCVAVGLVIYILSAAIGPLNRMTQYASALEQGDFDVEPPANCQGELQLLKQAICGVVDTVKSKIAEALKSAQEAEVARREARTQQDAALEAKAEAEQQTEVLIGAAGHIRDLTGMLSDASVTLGREVDMVSQGAGDQQRRTQENAAAMEQMNISILEVARNASNAATESADAKEKAVDGVDIVKRVALSVREVDEHSDAVNRSLELLEGQASDIGSIMAVITDIADQTNLLALNAAIEAARAGEAGRGFAVVADEVRKLAEKTMVATKEVGNAVSAIQDGTRESAEGMAKASEVAHASTALAQEAGEALQEILSLVERNADQIQAIATAAEEQSAASEEINRSVEEVSSISEQIQEGMSQAVVPLGQLSDLNGDLVEIVEIMARGDMAALENRNWQERSTRAVRPVVSTVRPPAHRKTPKPSAARKDDRRSLMVWDESLSVNVTKIDEQHKELVDLINELNDAMRSGKGKQTLQDVFRRLREYTVYHFSTEEELFAKYNYPGKLAHEKEHERLVNTVVELEGKFAKGQVAVTNEVMDFLKKWLLNHINGTDKRYSSFFNKNGVY